MKTGISAKGIAAQAKAQLAAQKAQLEAQKAELKQTESALKAELKQKKESLKAESDAAKAEALGKKVQIDSYLWLANWAKGSIRADKAEKAALKAIEKAEKTLEKIAAPKTPEYQNGNEIIKTDLPQTHADVLNLIAEGLSASVSTKGKSKGDVIIASARIDLANLKKKHAEALQSLITKDYVSMTQPDYYMLTDKGLAVFGLTLQQVKDNYLASLE